MTDSFTDLFAKKNKSLVAIAFSFGDIDAKYSQRSKSSEPKPY